LRVDGLSPGEIDPYHAVLRRQMLLWITLLFLDLLSVVGKPAH